MGKVVRMEVKRLEEEIILIRYPWNFLIQFFPV